MQYKNSSQYNTRILCIIQRGLLVANCIRLTYVEKQNIYCSDGALTQSQVLLRVSNWLECRLQRTCDMSVGRENHIVLRHNYGLSKSTHEFSTGMRNPIIFGCAIARAWGSLFRNAECCKPKYGPGIFSADLFTAHAS